MNRVNLIAARNGAVTPRRRRNPALGGAQCWVLALCGWLVLVNPLLAATVRAVPDRDPVRISETFNVVFSSPGSVDDDPDFRPLQQDFDIISQSQGSQLSMVNGTISQQQEWTLVLSPKRAGKLTIPPIAFGSDRSAPVTVTVLDQAPPAAADNAELKLEVEASPKDPYVQAQVIYTVRLLLRVNVAGADLSEPLHDAAPNEALVQRLGDDRRYSSSRNGLDYTVIERKYAIFPQQSGLLRIEALQLAAQVETGQRGFFQRATRVVRLKSEAIDLKVRPVPASFSGKHWLPAAELKLDEQWTQDPPQPNVGEPITRTLTLRAQGATLGLLPELDAGAAADPALKRYADQPTLNEDKHPVQGISASRQEKVALIPTRPGQITLPAVELPWWNTQTDRMEVARIPARVLHVGGVAAPSPPLVQPPPVTATEPAAVQPATPAPPRVAGEAGLWFWLALLFGCGWLATGLAWWWSVRGKSTASSVARLPVPDLARSESTARQAVQQACTKHDAAAARRALLAWAAMRWPEAAPVSLADVAGLGGAELTTAIAGLNRSLYGQGGAWQGDELWTAVAALGSKQTSKAAVATLEPLYR